jgi:hypothetical protein
VIDPQTIIDRMAETMTAEELARLPEGVAEHISLPGLLTDDQIAGVLFACRGDHDLTNAEHATPSAIGGQQADRGTPGRTRPEYFESTR